jgi:threonine/homoserine/homoserine lactone efflux protein
VDWTGYHTFKHQTARRNGLFAPLPAHIMGLGLTFAAITLVWLVFYAWGIERIGNMLQRPKIRRTLDAVMGTILVALGLRLAVEQR